MYDVLISFFFCGVFLFREYSPILVQRAQQYYLGGQVCYYLYKRGVFRACE